MERELVGAMTDDDVRDKASKQGVLWRVVDGTKVPT